ncbi:MAG: pyrE [Betaproteobacteria bacterium]|nr:pyrE [Betaproteobacteria bacterium]
MTPETDVTAPTPPSAARQQAARAVARALFDTGCAQARHDEPFRLPSGWASPVYMDCRKLISYPAIRRELVQQCLALLRERGVTGLEAVAGAETSGIALAAWLADALDVPMQYVRKKPRGFGPATQVEGVLKPGSRVLLVDDVMAGGQSQVSFCRALAAAGAPVKDAFVIFDYAAFPTGELLAPLGVTVHALADWRDMLALGRETGALPAAALAELEEFLHDPVRWSHAHGGIPSASSSGAAAP